MLIFTLQMRFARGFPSSPLALSKGFLKPMSDSGLGCAQARVFAQRIEKSERLMARLTMQAPVFLYK